MSNSNISSTTSSVRPVPSRRKWFVDLKPSKQERLTIAAAAVANNNDGAVATAANDTASLTSLGFSEQKVADLIPQEDDDRLLARRSWDIALGPLKQLPMNMIFAWMAGNSFSLMSIMIVVMLFQKPIQTILSLSSAFASLEQEGVGGNIWLLKLVYFLGSLTHLALALYKCQSMGLLPTYNSDWIAFADQQTQMEVTAGGFSYF
ncbi:unnamed protein product [Adineta steineri]|uniref:ER membrane protein complex subunit 4 n=1 Tax=Adineta steineri TaxID=433720 RepID=A0A815KF84_9BILA|nr:unnamed protein product [Adineta steineri]CAF3945870.1 unnamed protein product [Adineta steineri]